MYKRIVVPIDFSSESAAAVDTAADMARQANAEMVLINVIEDSYAKALASIGISRQSENKLIVDDLKKGIEKKLSMLVDKLNSNGIKTRFEVKIGNVFQTISQFVEEVAADLIVMGSKGVTADKEVLVGSITEKMVKYVKCPVITVKEKCDLTQIKSIVYPTDMKEEQETILEDIRRLQEEHGAKLHLVKVFDSEFLSKKDIETRMTKFANHFQLQNYAVTAIDYVDESSAILQYAQQVDATLIALATHHRRGLELLFNTGISENIVEQAQRPIWTKRVN